MIKYESLKRFLLKLTVQRVAKFSNPESNIGDNGFPKRNPSLQDILINEIKNK